MALTYIVICCFSALHDSVHEAGHGVVCRMRGQKVHISLGAYACQFSQPYCTDQFRDWTVEVHGELFYRPVYRTSNTCCSRSCQDPSNDVGVEPFVFMGGLFGLLGMWLICSITCGLMLNVNPSCFRACRSLAEPPSYCSRFRATQILAFCPELWLPSCAHHWPRWACWTALLTCCIAQIDLINEAFYAFTPSRTIVWEWSWSFDGVRQWLYWLGINPYYIPQAESDEMQRAALGIWVLLLLTYLAHITRFLRIALRLGRSSSAGTTAAAAAAAAVAAREPMTPLLRRDGGAEEAAAEDGGGSAAAAAEAVAEADDPDMKAGSMRFDQ